MIEDGTEHTECAVCGYEPDPDRVPPYYVLSLSDEDIDDGFVQSYPFGGSLSVPFACSDECWLDAQDEPHLVTDGGIEDRRTLADDRHDERPPFVDSQAEYAVCYFCGQTWEPAVVDGFDLSGEDEYYPKMVPVCPEHAGGCR